MALIRNFFKITLKFNNLLILNNPKNLKKTALETMRFIFRQF